MTLSERAAYLKGLKEGLKLNTETSEGKLLNEIIEMLEDVALSVNDLEDCTSADVYKRQPVTWHWSAMTVSRSVPWRTAFRPPAASCCARSICSISTAAPPLRRVRKAWHFQMCIRDRRKPGGSSCPGFAMEKVTVTSA